MLVDFLWKASAQNVEYLHSGRRKRCFSENLNFCEIFGFLPFLWKSDLPRICLCKTLRAFAKMRVFRGLWKSNSTPPLHDFQAFARRLGKTSATFPQPMQPVENSVENVENFHIFFGFSPASTYFSPILPVSTDYAALRGINFKNNVRPRPLCAETAREAPYRSHSS